MILMKKLWMMLFVVFLVACSSGETAKEAAPSEQAAQSESAPAEAMQAEAPPAAPVETQVEAPKEAAPVSGMPADFDGMMLSGAKCVSSKEGQTATLYFKDGKMRMDTMPVDAHAIYDSDMMYAWSGTTGTKMSRKDMEQMAKEAGQQVKSQEQVKSEMKDPGVHCEAASVSGDMFVPPAGIEFMDLAQMMQQQYGASMPHAQ